VTAAPDVLEMCIEPTDEFLIVASDGLWEVSGPNSTPKSIQIGNQLESPIGRCLTFLSEEIRAMGWLNR
jgi:hypothetical protein